MITRLSGLFIIGATLPAAAGCGIEKKESRQDETYTYSYSHNGCSTGRHEFKSKAQYCAALLNEDLNQGCAPEIRHKTHAQDCQ